MMTWDNWPTWLLGGLFLLCLLGVVGSMMRRHKRDRRAFTVSRLDRLIDSIKVRKP